MATVIIWGRMCFAGDPEGQALVLDSQPFLCLEAD